MAIKPIQNSQLRAIGVAVIGAAVAAAATMFVPTVILEGITGSTGLSELVPATAAPLGDTARALIAFGTGALVLAILAVLLSRQSGLPTHQPVTVIFVDEDEDDMQAASLVDRIKKMPIPKIAFPKMPWVKGENDITDLADLPRLRNGDAHPDAPARRPLLATTDLPELDLAGVASVVEIEPSASVEPVPEFAPSHEIPHIFEPAPVVAEPVVTKAIAIEADHQPTLAEMVAQLETAVAQRQLQLDALEAAAHKIDAEAPVVDVSIVEEPRETVVAERPPLEAVPSAPVKDDPMDAALSAALETLQRMNAAR